MGLVFYIGCFLGFLVALYLEIVNFVSGMLAMVILLIVALPLEIILNRRGIISWSATFRKNSKLLKALSIASLLMLLVVVLGRPPAPGPPDMVRDLSWLSAVGALYLAAIAIRRRFLPPDYEPAVSPPA
jgi:hypothetical protein